MRLLQILLLIATTTSLSAGRGGTASANVEVVSDNETPTLGTISVTGSGSVMTDPDMATINTGVTVMDKTARGALDQNTDIMTKIFAKLAEYSIPEEALQTTSFSVYPQYDYSNREPGAQPEIVGYRVTNSLSVKITDLDILGDVLDELVTIGSNQLGGISFGLQDPTNAINMAREKAMVDAESRALLYCEAAGLTLGDVMVVREPGAPTAYYSKDAEMADSVAMAPVPVASGEQEITASIHVVYAISSEVA